MGLVLGLANPNPNPNPNLARLHSTHSKPIRVDAPSSAAEHWRRGLRGDIGEMKGRCREIYGRYRRSTGGAACGEI